MKILIWDKGFRLSSKGGPIGYMYNIHEYLKENPCEQISFFSDVCPDKSSINTFTNNNQKLNIIKKSIIVIKGVLFKIKFFSFIYDLIIYYHWRVTLCEEDRIILSQYDFVHVHHLPTLMSLFLKNDIPAKIIFTTHFPEPLIDEIANARKCAWVLKTFPFIRKYYLKKEAKAISSVYKVLLPVREAIEAYTNNNSVYKKLFDDIDDKLFFVPTSIYPSEKIIDKKGILTKYNMDDSFLKVCFIGRHNHIKGYDQLQMIAQNLWKEIPNAYFIIGGKEEPLKGLNDKRWIELGWVDTFVLLEEIDVFLLPNKQTFFDLILIEVLRQGVPCVISKTGGNKWFEQFNLDGIRLYDYNDIKKASEQLIAFLERKDKGEMESIRNNNKMFFKEHFTVDKFIRDYITQLTKMQ